MNIVNYLETLVWEYTQLCQRPDGSVYGIASGKQCRKGTPISYNPNLANSGRKKGLKQVEYISKDKVRNLVAKAKAIGLTNKEIRSIKEEVKVELNKKRVRGTEALKLFARKANALAKTNDKGNQKPIPVPKSPKSIQDNLNAIYSNRKEALENSPKYTNVPGSKNPAAKSKVEEYLEIARTLSKDPYFQKDNNLKAFIEDPDEGIPLAVIYAKQGFNSRPELVPTARDLKERKGLLKKDNGENIIFYRGSTEEYTSQFLGIGPQGNIHGAGRGIHGNGTYAVATSKSWDKEETEARKTAIAYAEATGRNTNLKKQIVTFGLREDANVKDDLDSYADFIEWELSVFDIAKKLTGQTFNDSGTAMAALGIHAYKVPGGGIDGSEEDYWVILNRGAVVATVEEFE
jgi:hypothetical protein